MSVVLLLVLRSGAQSQWFHVYNTTLDFEFRSKDSLKCDSFSKKMLKEYENIYKDDPNLKNQYRVFMFKCKEDTIDQKDIQYFHDYFFNKPHTVLRLKLDYDTLFYLTPYKFKLASCEVFAFGNPTTEYLPEFYWKFEDEFLVFFLHQSGQENEHRYEEFYKDGFVKHTCMYNQNKLIYEVLYVEHSNYYLIEKYYNKSGRLYRVIDYTLLLDYYIDKNNRIYKKYKINRDRERIR